MGFQGTLPGLSRVKRRAKELDQDYFFADAEDALAWGSGPVQ